MLTTLGLGFMTPPSGMHLFVLSAITGARSMSISYRAIPSMISMLLVASLIAAIAQVSLVLLG